MNNPLKTLDTQLLHAEVETYEEYINRVCECRKAIVETAYNILGERRLTDEEKQIVNLFVEGRR